MRRQSPSVPAARLAALFGSKIIGYTVSFGQSLMTPKTALAARLLAAESQLTMCTHPLARSQCPRQDQPS